MKSYTTSQRIIDWRRQQMIQIDYHCCCHNQKSKLPSFWKKDNTDHYGNNKMQGNMQQLFIR